jgi:hypothetical protein
VPKGFFDLFVTIAYESGYFSFVQQFSGFQLGLGFIQGSEN